MLTKGSLRAFFTNCLEKAGGEYIVSPKNYSLALDESVKEFGNDLLYDNNFEAELTVIVSAYRPKAPNAMTSNDVICIAGRITVSF